jgi:hypothetical protein
MRKKFTDRITITNLHKSYKDNAKKKQPVKNAQPNEQQLNFLLPKTVLFKSLLWSARFFYSSGKTIRNNLEKPCQGFCARAVVWTSAPVNTAGSTRTPCTTQLHGGQYVNDNLCFTCANAKSVQHRGKPLSYADFDPAGYGTNDFIQLGKWLEYLQPLYKAALLRPS